MNFDHTEHFSPEELQLYQKGLEIFDTVHLIAELIPPEDKHLNIVKDQMLGDALILSTKVSGAAVMDMYDLKMESATLIRKAARDLMVQNHALEMYGFKEVDYFQMEWNTICVLRNHYNTFFVLLYYFAFSFCFAIIQQ